MHDNGFKLKRTGTGTSDYSDGLPRVPVSIKRVNHERLLPCSDTEDYDPLLYRSSLEVLASNSTEKGRLTFLEVAICLILVGTLVADVGMHFLPVSRAVSLALAISVCSLSFVYFCCAKLSALAIRGVLRELKASNSPGENLVALFEQRDLEAQLNRIQPKKEEVQNAMADALVQIITASLKEATTSDELREVLTTTVLAALNDEQLKAGLKEVMITGLKDKDVHAAAISGSVQGIAQSFTSGFGRAKT
jgi:hypothetical protein